MALVPGGFSPVYDPFTGVGDVWDWDPFRRGGFGNQLANVDPFYGRSALDPFDMSMSAFPTFGRELGFPSIPREVSQVANTRVDWVETPEAHVFHADVPGLRREEVKVQVTDDGVLNISGERSKEEKEEKDLFSRYERSYGKFARQFRLPSDSKLGEVSAKVDHGVLTVTVPKTEVTREANKFRDVEIAT